MGKTQGVKASSTPKPKKASRTQVAPPCSARRSTKPGLASRVTAGDDATGEGADAPSSLAGAGAGAASGAWIASMAAACAVCASASRAATSACGRVGTSMVRVIGG